MICECRLCGHEINQPNTGEPYLPFNGNIICYNCYTNLIPEIYKMAGSGDGGIIHLSYKYCLISEHNRSKRIQIRNYNKILNELKHKYKFSCVHCGSKKNLTIDHIKPVSKGGGDEISNLQLLCKSCNSKKCASWDE